ncbi:type I DNA topoisomerase [bacterium]|nr:type I DNA topoisomerase [bacterium]
MPKKKPQSSGRPLVIVESPAKVRTIKRYLGARFDVASSRGHIRDLPKRNLNVDIEHGFEPTYEVIPDKEKIVAQLKRAAKRAGAIYLACDPDREGEAICWHLATLINGKGPIYRITFNEITRAAVERALKHPGEINQNLVDAQQARRVLDRLVGYQVSPILWKTVRRGLSAGRVQSVALRLVVEREIEREAFVTVEFWPFVAGLATPAGKPFNAELAKLDGKKAVLGDWDAARELLYEVRDESWTVRSFEKRLHERQPQPPYITSTLQQDASTRLGFETKRTMVVAQQLYEGVELGELGRVGLITYMRTDSVRISAEGLELARSWIEANHPKHLPEKPRTFERKKRAQDAHEAIRPTDPTLEPERIKSHLAPEQFRLYDLVWRRFLACQMTPALSDKADAKIEVGRALFTARGSILRDPGFLTVYPDVGEAKDVLLPELGEGYDLELLWLDARQRFTQPPPRYKPASLVKELEKRGIGRPSTYVAIISTLQQRDYVRRDENRSFAPTELGRLVTKLLLVGFPEVLKVEFTAELEGKLDGIARGEKGWRDVLEDFYKTFSVELRRAAKSLPEYRDKSTLLAEPACPECGAKVNIRIGRAGAFVGCSKYPECDFTADFERNGHGRVVLLDRKEEAPETGESCEKCGRPMTVKKGRYGPFLACTGYPECDFTSNFRRDEDGNVVLVKRERKPTEKTDVPCPECGGPMVVRHGRKGEFLGCSRYPECRGTLNFARDADGGIVPVAPEKDGNKGKKNNSRPAPEPLGLPCPKKDCGGGLVKRVNSYGNDFYACDRYPACRFSCNREPVQSSCPSCGFPWREPFYKKLRCHHCGKASAP